MSHSAGLPGVEPESGVTAQDMLYLDRHIGALETMAPVWMPGASCHYHPITYGSLLDAVVRRVSGKSIAKHLADDISGPLNLDFWIGLPLEEDKRVAPHFQPTPGLSGEQIAALLTAAVIDITTRLAKVVLLSLQHTGELISDPNGRPLRAAEMPAGNGVTNAAALAKMYAAMIGEVDGVRLLKPETVDQARTVRTAGMVPPGDLGKLQIGLPTQYGLGYQLSREGAEMMGPGSFGHDGAGGRIAFAHPESGVAAAFVANTMASGFIGPDPRWAWIDELRKAVAA